MEAFIVPVAIIHGLSILYLIIMCLQFYRIHKKRVGLLKTFDSQGELIANITTERWQSYVTIITYVVVTIGITIVSSALLFLRPHWL